MTPIKTKHPTFYKTAQIIATGVYCTVIAQDAVKKEDVKHLLLRRPYGQVWHSIKTLNPCL